MPVRSIIAVTIDTCEEPSDTDSDRECLFDRRRAVPVSQRGRAFVMHKSHQTFRLRMTTDFSHLSGLTLFTQPRAFGMTPTLLRF